MQNITKRVSIQDLEDTGKLIFTSDSINNKKQMLKRKCTHYGDCTCKIIFYEESCNANIHYNVHPFYDAFCQAYNNHKDVILSPDDVWVMITLEFSKYINNNAEAMRNLFVDHEGKKKLTVVTRNELDESQWDEFYDLIIGKITDNTKDGITGILAADFTTTGRVEKIISTSVIMNSFKQYFSYGRCIPACGITGIQFMGESADWKKLIEKTRALQKYNVEGVYAYSEQIPRTSWSGYIDKLIPILTEFSNTFDENVNVDFWNSIMDVEHKRLGSGSQTMVNGWITYFFGLYGKFDCSAIKNYISDFEVTIDNRLTGVVSTVNMVSGFNNLYYNGSGYRPQMALAVLRGFE